MTNDNVQQPDTPSRAKVFLSYSRADPNADVVHAAYSALAGRHEVFCDIGQEPGEEWAPQIEAALADADYFVVFLSAEANRSRTLTEEARRAVKRKGEIGRPRILPVLLAYSDEDLGLDLGALLKPFNFIALWQTPEDTGDLIEHLQRVLAGAWTAPAFEIAPALSRYQVSAARAARIREAFVPPPDVEKARDLLWTGQIIWITGPAGSGKHFLASALACEMDEPTFELRRTLSWRHIFQNRPTKSVVVLPDALAPERAGLGDFEAELAWLRRICETDKTDNTILLTCTDEEYSARNRDLLDADFTPAQLARYRLTNAAYPLSLRTAIVRTLVAQSHAAGVVSLTQRQWTEKLLDGQHLPWNEWTLSEIESFVTRSLPNTAAQADVVQLLDRHTTIEDQVHTWFLALGEAARSLLLTLLLFPEATPEHIWARFRAVLSQLEMLRLVPQVSIPTLGVCRAYCAPYVTETDDLEIVDSDIASAIRRELAVSWREYVIELRPLLTGWALPPAGQDRALTRSGADVKAAVRQELARLLGELLKVRVEDVLPLLGDFATFEQSAVRRTAAEAIVHAFGSEDGAHHGRKLLQRWESDRSGETAAVRQREVAAEACWRIAATSQDAASHDFALEQLHRFARDIPRVRAVVAYGLGRLVSRRSAQELQPLLTRLARDPDEIVRRRTGVALGELNHRAPDIAETVSAEWLASGDPKRLWTAAYALLVTRRPRRGDRDRAHAVMERDPTAFSDALASSLTPGDLARDTDRTESATQNVIRLASDAESTRRFAIALGTHWAAHPDRGALLCEQLGRLGAAPVHELLVEAYQHRLFAVDSVTQLQEVVLADVAAGGTRRPVATRAVTVLQSAGLEDGLGPEVAEAWEAAPELFERFLGWLRSDLGDTGRRAATIQRRHVLERLIPRPAELVNRAAGWLKTPELGEEVREAIGAIMKTPELRAPLLLPLVTKYWNARPHVELILGQLDGHSSGVVRQMAFDGLLDDSPRRFLEAAIEETQDREEFRAEALAALARVAETKGPAMAVAIRRGVSAANRRAVLRLIGDFRVSDPRLVKVAGDLWLTHFWLSFQQLVSAA